MSNLVWEKRRAKMRWRRLAKKASRVPLNTPVTEKRRDYTITLTFHPAGYDFDADYDDDEW